MESLSTLYQTQPFWLWIALGAALLAAEIATGSGYLLWPAAAAGVVALITGFHLGLPVEVLIFAVLTIASTMISRRFMPQPFGVKGPDINDPHERLVGKVGTAVANFHDGRGRVFIDGKEWAAELEGEGPVTKGADLKVVKVLGGAHLGVRLA